jgi:CoA:oxalate CoA-transferase
LTPMPGPLQGIRVLDLSQLLLGPFATLLLSDLGAEVVKVERPGMGDVSRGSGRKVRGVSLYFLSLNRGKKSLVIDLTTGKGRDLLVHLAEKADILVENFSPGTMDRLGLGYEFLKTRNQRLIYAAGSGFGSTGPYANKPAFDITVQAMGGILSTTGEENGGPVRPGASYGDIAAGLFLCTAMLAALHQRDVTGQGQFVDIGMLDCQVTVQENAFARYLNTGETPSALGARHPENTPFQTFRTRDGYVALALKGGLTDQWPLFCTLIGRTDIIDDPRFADGWLRTENYQVLEPMMNQAFRSKATAEWLAELDAAGIACSPVNTIAEAANNLQIAARGMIRKVDQPGSGTFRLANSPFEFSRTHQGSVGAPELGEHSAEILKSWLGMTDTDVAALRRDQVV